MTKLEKARKFCYEVGELAKKYNLPVFVVTDGASLTRNSGNPAVRFHREKQIEWEEQNNFDPNEDWGSSFEAMKSYIKKNAKLYENNLAIRRAGKSDKKIIRDFVLKTDEYYLRTCPTFAKNYNKNPDKIRKQSETFVDRINIRDFHIMELKGKPIGTIMEWNNDGETTLINFYVDEKYRGNGYGRILLEHVIDNMKNDYCVLSVYKENKKSVDFYYKFGFKYLQEEKTDSGILYWLRYDK